MISFAIVEDDQFIQDRIVDFIQSQPHIDCKIKAGSIEEFLEKSIEVQDLDVLLCDIGLPGMSGIEGISKIQKKYPKISIMMLSVYVDSDRIFKALCAGATGYLQKDTPLEEILNSIEILHQGGSAMSPAIARKVVEYFKPQKKHQEVLSAREMQVVQGLVDGLSYKMIGDRLGISIQTVRQHIKSIYRKLEVNSKGEVISKSLKGEL